MGKGIQIIACKVTFVLTRPTTDERHYCNDFQKTLFFVTAAK